MALSEAQLEARRSVIGGSDARTIMHGSAADWKALYEEKKNGVRPVFKPATHLLMDMGHALEPLALREFARKVGPLRVLPPEHGIVWKVDPFFAFTPDGLMAEEHAAVQAKFHSGDKDITQLGEYYGPQVLHEMLCLGASYGYLAVIFGHYGRFMHLKVELDEAALDAYLLRAMQFREYLLTGEPPEGMAVSSEVAIPRKRDHFWLPGDNEVAPLCREIMENAGPALRFEDALEKIKPLVPKDAGSATWLDTDGNGLKFKANARGAISWSLVTAGAVASRKGKKAAA